MVDIDHQLLKKLAHLCRINVAPEDAEALLRDLRNIVKYIEQLDELNPGDTPPCNHVLSEIVNVMRDDTLGASLSRDDLLANAPAHVGGMIRVPPVLRG